MTASTTTASRFRRSLSYRFALAIIVAGTVVAYLAIGAQTFFAYRRVERESQAQLSDIGASIVPSIADGLWDVDLPRVELLVDGIARLPDVAYVELNGVDGEHAVRGNAYAEALASQTYPLVYNGAKPTPLGTLRVVIGRQTVYTAMISQGESTAIVTALSILAVAWVVWILFRRLVTQHLVAIAAHAERMTSMALTAPMVLPGRKQDAPDDMRQLVSAFNRMQTNLRTEFDLRQRSEQALLEHKNQLEVQVEERTRELADKNTALEDQNDLIRRSEERYRLLADNLRDVIFHVRADGLPLFVSASSIDVLGYAPGDIPFPWWDLVHPQELALVQSALTAASGGERPQQLIFRMLHKDGEYVWVEALARRVFAGTADRPAEFVYSARDISKRVAAQRGEVESRRRLQAIADSLPAIIAYFDKNCVYEFANAELGELLGIDPKTLVGKTLREAVGQETYNVIEPFVIQALCGERVVYERIATLRGEHRHLEVTFIPDVAADGSTRGFFALSYDITARKQKELSLTVQARCDSLTGVANRREFERRLSAALASRAIDNRAIGLMLIDVDHFKSINDSLGHNVGDAVLMAIAKRLQNSVYDTDLVARIGGDEFAILLDSVSQIEDARRIAERVMASVRRPILAETHLVSATLSIGIALSLRAESIVELTALADKALYRAKAAGRDTFDVEHEVG